MEIIIQNPYGSTEYQATSVSKTRHSYSYLLTIDSSFSSGTYKIAHQFDGQIFYREEIYVTKESSIVSTPSQKEKKQDEVRQQQVAGRVKAKQEREQKEIDEQKKQLKKYVETLQYNSYIKLDRLRNGVTTAEDSLKQIVFDMPKQKESIDKAWDLLKINKQKINDITERYQTGDGQLDIEFYENAKSWYRFSETDSKQVGDNLQEISNLIEKAKETSKLDKIQPKTCFLWWCW